MTDLQETAAQLSGNERRVLKALAAHPGATAGELLAPVGLMQTQEVVNAANWLVAKGLATASEETEHRMRLGEEGKAHARGGLSERRAIVALAARANGRASLAELVKDGTLDEAEGRIVIGWLKRKGWASVEKGDSGPVLVAAEPGETPPMGADEALLEQLLAGEQAVPELDAAALKDLKGRKGLLEEREITTRRYTLSELGTKLAAAGFEAGDAIGQLTPEHIASGAWKDQALRPYDIDMHVPPPSAGKPHPLQLLIEEIRDVFVALGFTEIQTDYVENAFWNMDVLFIPQDHPAREMQDTFYLDHPATIPAPDALKKTVKGVHEHGGDTGSTGWGGTWHAEEANRALLRTHTTVGTIRHLYENPVEPCKVFSIGRVFRKETMDATHLPEFHQIEGIIKEPTASFRELVGVLRSFYTRMGFPEVRLRPAYFPYTEPSMEIEVKHAGRWMELGGAGIFRPEVTEPLGVADPVCAWGLGLERLAMMRFGLKDIRELFLSDVDWLRNAPLMQR